MSIGTDPATQALDRIDSAIELQRPMHRLTSYNEWAGADEAAKAWEKGGTVMDNPTLVVHVKTRG